MQSGADSSVSFIGFPHGEALATWALAIAGLTQLAILVLQTRTQRKRWELKDNRAESQTRLQVERWDLEDQARKLAANLQERRWGFEDLEQRLRQSPHYTFGFKDNEDDAVLWCANLGKFSFVVEAVHFRFTGGDERHFRTALVAPVDGQALTPVFCSNFSGLKLYLPRNCDVWLTLSSHHGSQNTQSKPFTVLCPPLGKADFTPGFKERFTAECPKCKGNGVFDFTDAINLDAAREMTEAAAEALSESCPRHHSIGLRSFLNADGRKVEQEKEDYA